MPQLWTTMLDEAKERWRVSRRLAIGLFFAPLLAFICVALVRIVDPDNWAWYRDEGGLIEWLQFCMLLVAIVFSALIARQLLKSRVLASLLYLVLAGGLFFVAGEEIAWGQTLLKYDTPTGLAQINYKAEMSMHNISSLVSAFDIGKLLIGAYGAFAGFGVLWLRRRLDVEDWDIIVPPLCLASPFLVVFLFRTLRFTLLREGIPTGSSEFEELCLYFGMMAFTWLVWRRVRAAPLEPQPVQRQPI